ncbi:MAG: hypothetical protein KJ941_09900, partial [Bacteroidetes bacterium]|nr:hypothetical protein [Bacteroidota bacterium]
MKRTYKLIHGFVFATVITTAVQAQSPNWTVNPGGFNNSMNVTSVANVACVELTNNANKIAAFVGAECRGVVNTSTDANGRKLAFLLVYSNTTSGEKVKFKIYDSNTNTVYDSKDSLVFSNNASYGTVSLPYIVSTNHAPTAIALANSTVSENSAINTIVGGLSASDPDNNFAPVFTMDPSGI